MKLAFLIGLAFAQQFSDPTQSLAEISSLDDKLLDKAKDNQVKSQLTKKQEAQMLYWANVTWSEPHPDYAIFIDFTKKDTQTLNKNEVGWTISPGQIFSILDFEHSNQKYIWKYDYSSCVE